METLPPSGRRQIFIRVAFCSSFIFCSITDLGKCPHCFRKTGRKKECGKEGGNGKEKESLAAQVVRCLASSN